MQAAPDDGRATASIAALRRGADSRSMLTLRADAAPAARAPARRRRVAGPGPGKTLRLKRLIPADTGACIICALDHGMTSPRFLDGLFDTRARLREAQAGGAH